MRKKSKNYRRRHAPSTTVSPPAPLITTIEQEVIPAIAYSVGSTVMQSLTKFVPLPQHVKTFASAAVGYSSYNVSTKHPIAFNKIWSTIKDHKIKSSLLGLGIVGAGIATGAITNAVASIPGLAANFLDPMVLLGLMGQNKISALTRQQTQAFSSETTTIAQALITSIATQNPEACALVGAEFAVKTALSGIDSATTYLSNHKTQAKI